LKIHLNKSYCVAVQALFYIKIARQAFFNKNFAIDKGAKKGIKANRKKVTSGAVVLRAEPIAPSATPSNDNLAQLYVFVNGVIGVWANWFRPTAKQSTGYLTQKRDSEGNFCR